MGAFVGLIAGLGILLILASGHPPRVVDNPGLPRLRTLLDEAGLPQVSMATLVSASVACGLLVGLGFLAMSRVATVALAFGLLAAWIPITAVRARARRRRAEMRELWPDAVDNLASAVRAGLSLPEALAALGYRGPEPLREPFRTFGEDYRATGRVDDSLDRLKDRLADPTGDRIVESLRVAREVGGSDVGRLLRTLSSFLRDELRTRAELETRQAWVVNAARLAVAAPWVLLALMASQQRALAAFGTPQGAVVLLVGAGVCLVAYRMMVSIGRLPEDMRVLR